MIRLALLALICVFSGRPAHAASFVFDANAFYFSDAFTYGGTSSDYSRVMWELAPGFSLNKKGTWVLSWNYANYTLTENPGTETTLSISDMGPRVSYYFNRDRTWGASFTYNLITNATYSAGAETELRGTSMKFEFGYTPMMWDGVYMGAKLNYYKAAFKEEITGETNLEKVSYDRTVIYPTFSMTIRFD